MEAKGRALFNTLQFTAREDPSLEFESWQVEDYRQIPTEELFGRLATIGIALDEARFLGYVNDVASPEELIEALWVGEDDDEGIDQAYLILFELWRRFASEKQSLSIFCDELDHLIDLFDSDQLDDDEPLQTALADLEGLLDEYTDQGEDPHDLFSEICLYCALDLESFIYDYAADEIDRDHPLNASELIDGFYPYISDQKWFAFLRLRLLFSADPEEAEVMFDRILEELEEDPEFELFLEIARFLVNQGGITQFIRVIKSARPYIETEEDFQDLIAQTGEFYRLLDRDTEAEEVLRLLGKRLRNPPEQEISEADPGLKAFYSVLEDFKWSEA